MKKFIIAVMIGLLAGCASAPRNTAANSIQNSTVYSSEADRAKFEESIAEVLSGANTIQMQEAVAFDKKDKAGIKAFMESMKASMVLCNTAATTPGLKSKAILVACEPFFRHVARSEYGDNLKTLRTYGMGKKIALAVLAGAAGAAMVNSNNFNTIIVTGTITVTAATLATLPNDWQAIGPYVQKVQETAYNAWLVAKINESVE